MATAMTFQYDDPLIERQSICLPGVLPGIAIHAGEADFKAKLDRVFANAENNATEKLVALKAELKKLDTEAFWNRLMEGLAELCRAQFGFVSKRILVDDHDTAIEMPPIGELGSCLMGVALYYNDGKEMKNMSRDYKYYAWGAPCSNMRHDKVFLVPEGLSTFITDNPNKLPFECDGYLGIPLFADDKCFAHFGLMWTKEGLEMKKDLSWGYIEMLMHSLEDMITDRLVSGQGFARANANTPRPTTATPEPAPKVIPRDFVTPAQSLKPYAKSLSHELRTPMQGVVGMLDVIYATVQEQLEEQSGSKMVNVFKALKDNIETVQDSSKRAIEAADNVVYAYDLNMQVPETPFQDMEASTSGQQSYFDSRPKMVEGSNIVNPFKRRRSSPNTWNFGNPTKVRQTDHPLQHSPVEMAQSPFTRTPGAILRSPKRRTPRSTPSHDPDRFEFPRPSLMTPAETDMGSTPGVRQCNIRELVPIVIHDALRVGGRPDSAISEPIPFGERVEVRTRSSNGHTAQKTIEWSIEADVPDIVAMDERDLSKLISAVFLNAIKFTETGTINLHAKLNQNGRYILITVADTGSGIPEDFQPELFKAFAKEDHSITRTKEGLGLGLLVAKGLARRTGGDIALIRSATTGVNHGTEFEIRIPVEHGDRLSRSSTPFSGTPGKGMLRSTPLATAIPQKPSPRVEKSSLSPMRLSSPNDDPGANMSAIHKLVTTTGSDEKRPSLSRRPSAVPKDGSRAQDGWDRKLAEKYPLNFLVAEDNKINRKLLVNMLGKLGYKNVYEAFDGREAVRIMDKALSESKAAGWNPHGSNVSPIDVVLMDLWMPEMDGYEATEKILAMFHDDIHGPPPTILAVSADVTVQAVDRATRTGMQGYMTKPYKLIDLQRLILEFCASDVRKFVGF